MSGWLHFASLGILLLISADGSDVSWERHVGPPVDPCLGPVYNVHIKPDETLALKSADGRIYWSVMVGDRGIEVAACSANQSELISINTKRDYPKATTTALRWVTRELVLHESASIGTSQLKQYITQIENLQKDMTPKLMGMIATERNRDPNFPKNRPLILWTVYSVHE